MRRALLLTATILGASAALAQNVSPYRILPGINGVPSIAPHITATPVPVGSYAPYTAQPSTLPGLLYQLDAAMPTGTAPAVSGTPGIQVDASNNVLAASLPDGTVLLHGYGESLLVLDGWSTGRPVLRGTAAQPNSAYDSLLVPVSVAKRTVQSSQSNDFWFVVKQISPGSNELFRTLLGSSGVKVFGAPGATDCALQVQSNLGSANGVEPSSALTACGQRQVIEIISDDSTGTITLLRNGTVTLTTSAGQINAFTPDSSEILNHCLWDAAYIEDALGYPSIAQRQAELKRQAALYPLDGTVSPITFGVTTAKPPVAVDLQGDFLTTVNVPTAGGNGVPFPLNSNIAVGDGLAMESGATQQFGAIFGTATPNANITTTQQVYNTFYTTTMEGNLDQAIGGPMDTGQSNNSTFFTVLRTCPPTSPNNLHVVGTDGLHLRAACSASHTNCGPGNIYGAGIILSQLPIRPGMTIKLRRRSPKGDLSWVPAWLFSINQGIPPTGNTSLYSDAAKAAMHNCGQTSYLPYGACEEIDIDDGFSRAPGTVTGYQVNHGYPNIYGGIWERGKFPHQTYGANGSGYVAHLNAGPDYEELPFDQSAAFHDMVFDWRPDGSMNVFEDGKLIISGYLDYTKSVSYQDASNGNALAYVGMQLMIMNQAVPGFAPNHTSAVDNDGLGVDGWAAVYQEIGIWKGNVANAQTFLAGSTNAYAGNTGDPTFNGITWTIGGGVVFSDGGLAASQVTRNDGTPETSSLVLVGLSTSSTTAPSCKGGTDAPATCFGATSYYNNGAGAWINSRKGPDVIPALASGTYYYWVQTPDGVNHLASSTPYVK